MKDNAIQIPMCTDQKTYKLWISAARMTGGISNKAGFCIDCLPEYQTQMIKRGKCSNPGILFREDKDGFVEGYLPRMLPIEL